MVHFPSVDTCWSITPLAEINHHDLLSASIDTSQISCVTKYLPKGQKMFPTNSEFAHKKYPHSECQSDRARQTIHRIINNELELLLHWYHLLRACAMKPFHQRTNHNQPSAITERDSSINFLTSRRWSRTVDSRTSYPHELPTFCGVTERISPQHVERFQHSSRAELIHRRAAFLACLATLFRQTNSLPNNSSLKPSFLTAPQNHPLVRTFRRSLRGAFFYITRKESFGFTRKISLVFLSDILLTEQNRLQVDYHLWKLLGFDHLFRCYDTNKSERKC